MTDREALLALAISEPEIRWDSRDHSNTESLKEWDTWNRNRNAALKYARGLIPDAKEESPSSP